MSNVVDIFKDKDKDDFDCCTYFENDNGVGVAMKDKSMLMLPVGLNEIEVIVGDENILLSRKDLSEFLHVATIFFDSESKYQPKGQMVGLNYK